MDNTFLDLQNSSYPTPPHSIIEKCYSTTNIVFLLAKPLTTLSVVDSESEWTIDIKRSVSLRFQSVFEEDLLLEVILKQDFYRWWLPKTAPLSSITQQKTRAPNLMVKYETEKFVNNSSRDSDHKELTESSSIIGRWVFGILCTVART